MARTEPLLIPKQAAPSTVRKHSPRRQRAIDQLGQVLPAIKRKITEQVADASQGGAAPVTPHQADALCMLSREGAMSMNDLARNLNIAMSTATALADRLLKQGQVERIADPTDRRVVRLGLTADAADTVKHHMHSRREALLAALDVLDDDELESLLALLGKVALGPLTTTGGTEHA